MNIITIMLAATMSVSNVSFLPKAESEACIKVAREYALDSDQTALLMAIRRVENGRPGLEFGIASDFPNHPARRYNDGKMSFLVQARWCAGTIRKRYTGDLNAFAKRYCPPNHCAWELMVRRYMRKAREEARAK